MTKNTKLDEKLEGAENFRAWKYIIMLILQENDLDQFVKEEVKETEGDESKCKHKKDMIIAKIIIADSIKDNLIPRVSSMETPKGMFDALSGLSEGRNINRNMTLVDVYVTSECISLVFLIYCNPMFIPGCT